ncbi:MAG: helix-turn-helix domain-containing protein [Deltaproteobacteria bacterium]|jgi:hypothetical protein|nr:helix-turn-helix domain-containing protein [Deltaproteobacteria bacterium]
MTAQTLVKLTDDDRRRLGEIIDRNRRSAKRSNTRIERLAMALLWSDCSPEGPSWSADRVSEALGLTAANLERLKRRFLAGGVDGAFTPAPSEPRPSGSVVADPVFAERLAALAASKAPEGHERWSVRLLARVAVEKRMVDSISHTTVFRILKMRQTAS